MASDPGAAKNMRSQGERREQRIAWATTILACLYCGWMGLHLWQATGTFADMFKALAVDLPTPTRILIDHGVWIYPVTFGGIIATLIAKEWLMRDKRLSTMLTFLVAMGAQFLGHWMTTVYSLPMFRLISKLR